MVKVSRGALVQIAWQSTMRNARVTQVDGPYCEIAFTEGLDRNPYWVLSMSLRKVPEEVEKPRFEEPARGMYAKIPFKSDMVWVTILDSGVNYTLVCYEDNHVDCVVTSSLKGCFMKPNHPALKIKTGDCVHLAKNSDFSWATVLDVDRDYVLVKYSLSGEKNWVLLQSIVAKTKPEKKVETIEVAEEKGNTDNKGQAGRVWTGNSAQKVLLGLM